MCKRLNSQTTFSKRFLIQYDWYHAQITGDLSHTTKKFFPKIEHFQLAGIPDRAELARREVNFPHLFHLVDAPHYEGWIGPQISTKRPDRRGSGMTS
jgi:hydroxypyruvate isomerase